MDYEQPLDSTTLDVPFRNEEAEDMAEPLGKEPEVIAGPLVEYVDEQPTMRIKRPRPRPFTRAGKAWGRTTPQMRVVGAVALLALLALLGVVVVRALPPDAQLARTTLGTLDVSFPAPGTLSSVSYDVNFAAQGRVAQIDVRVGQTVTEGQTLAKLDSKLLQDAVANAQARQHAAQSALDGAQATQAQVQAQGQAEVAAAYEQEQTSLKSCKTGDTACESRATNTYAAAQARANANDAQASAAVDAAQAQLTVAQSDLQTAQDNLNGSTLTAPHNGTVSEILGTVGSAAGPGSGAAFIRVVDLARLRLTAQVSANDIGDVQTQQPVRFTVPTFAGRTFLGVVDTVGPAGQQAGGATRYPVTILVDMNSLNGARLLPGMSATATITTYSHIGVALVPASAAAFARAAANPKSGGFLPKSQVQRALDQAQRLRLDFESAGKEDASHPPTPSYLVRWVSDRWVVVPVLLGQSDGRRTEVLSAGMPGSLKVGDTVVTAWNGGPVTVPAPTPAVH